MKKVFIPQNSTIPVERQFSSRSMQWGNYEFVVSRKSEGIYDFVVVLDDLPNTIHVECPKNHILLFIGEPPSVKLYPHYYLKQFGYFYSCQKRLDSWKNHHHLYPMLPWMLYYNYLRPYSVGKDELDYDYFKQSLSHQRLNKICLLTSNKRFTKGHKKRINFALKLKELCPELVDIYGSGFGQMDYKYDVLSKYKYSIVIENCSYPDYWTEKLADAFLAGCYPIYYGASNIYRYFDRNQLSIINIEDFENSVLTIKQILQEDRFEKCKLNIEEAKHLILDKYNMFSQISIILDEIGAKGNMMDNDVKIIKPLSYNLRWKVLNRINKLFY